MNLIIKIFKNKTMKFVSKDLALKLKEKGFNKPCFGYYYIETPTGFVDGELVLNRYPCRGGTYKETLERHASYFIPSIVDAPTIEQALEWLREEKEIMVFPVYSKNTSRWYCEIVNADSLESEKLMFPDSYEDCCIEGIKYTINNLI